MNQEDQEDLIRWAWGLRDPNKPDDESVTRIANAYSISEASVREILK